MMNVNAKISSFHAVMKEKMLVATRPGATSGKRTRRKIWARLAPSMAAASSSSLGTAATKPRSIQTANGSEKPRYVRIRLGRVL